MSYVLMVRSAIHNPWHNLALEALLLDHYNRTAEEHPAAILFLWQNEHTVVIGRHQNAWAECNVQLLEKEGGCLARRSTGGGAVYHDLGNLNYSLILPRSQFDLDLTFQIILEAVCSIGLHAERSGRNDLLLNGLKFSGNAFSRSQHAGLHHGTVLVSSDHAKIGRYLAVDTARLKARGVPSVRSRITNLQTKKPNLTVEIMSQALSKVFLSQFAANQVIYQLDSDFKGSERLDQLKNQYASWEWRFGKSLHFDSTIEARFDWGLIYFAFSVDQGIIKHLNVQSDALDGDFIRLIPGLLTGRRFNGRQLADTLEQFDFGSSGLPVNRKHMARDLSLLLSNQTW